MFGYIVANDDLLTVEEKQHYRSCYCGLCRTLGNRHGKFSRITLTYDMTFLVLFLSALYNKNTPLETERCIIHPIKPHSYWQNEISDYGADMNVLMAYYNFLDDWTDDKKLWSLAEAKLFEKEALQISVQYPRQGAGIRDSLRELSRIEKIGEINADIPAECFGNLLGEIFVFREDEYAENLRAFGRSLGKFIYILDASQDLKNDIKKERYNPLIWHSSDNFTDILNLLMADCIDQYEKLPIEQHRKLIENNLYSGVWTRYNAKKEKIKEKDQQ